MVFVDRRDGEPVPYDLTENFLSVLGADGDETGAILAVIIPADTVRFPV